MLSYELADIFYHYSLQFSLKKGFKLVDQCFDNFPKDEESITKIILINLQDSTIDFKEKLYFRTLIDYLDNLYLEFLMNQA